MVWVKICGVRDLDTARALIEARPDAIGLNFYPRSSRLVALDDVAAIVAALPDAIEAVGVFVNAQPAAVASLVRQCGLRRVQFHGDEPPEQLAEFHRLLPEVPLIRAWRRDARGLGPLIAYLQQCSELGVPISAVLLDASRPGDYGGTGTVLPWSEVRQECETIVLPPVILAGGLTPENVAHAVRTVRPWGVDVASGVETAPGVKDVAAVARFIQQARAAA
jgi:phosphoribosylanthranilate isomerase